MKAMILAAGRGERMRPLTDTTPKPLLEVAGKPLIVHHLESLVRAGYREVVINTSYLAEQIHEHLGDGAHYGIHIEYSYEGESPLETGGGILKALPLMGKGQFLAINGDTWCDYPWHRLRQIKTASAHLLLVDNPEHHPAGDFSLSGLRLAPRGDHALTYAGIAVYHPNFFTDCTAGTFSVAPMLKAAAEKGSVTAEHYRGAWCDVGTVERLEQLRARLA